MNQFFAIMKEAFWSTLATRLLYFEIFGVLIVLLALAPLTYQEEVRYRLVENEVRTGSEAIKYWVASSERTGESSAKVLWERLDEAQRTTLLDRASQLDGETSEQESAPRRRRGPRRSSESERVFVEAANSLIVDSTVFDDERWRDLLDNRQTREMWEKRESLTADYQKRLNRLIFQEAFRGQIDAAPESNAVLYYGTFRMTTVFMSGFAMENWIKDWLPFLLDKLFLTVGVLLAILVTAPMIPQMLEEGSLYLLLSKPISRLFLLTSKVMGSGIMITIVSSLFLTGLWALLGLRFGIWMSAILWCIPLAVAIFMIYYSVTVCLGLLFRNVILSIIGTILFAAVCYLLSFSRYTYSGLVAFQRTAEVEALGDQLVRRTAHNHVQLLDEANNRWTSGLLELGRDMPQEVFDVMWIMMPTRKGTAPAYWAKYDLILGEIQHFPPNESRDRKFFATRTADTTSIMRPKQIGSLPFGTLGFWFDPQDRVYVINSYGKAQRLDDSGLDTLKKIAAGQAIGDSPPATTESTSEESAEIMVVSTATPADLAVGADGTEGNVGEGEDRNADEQAAGDSDSQDAEEGDGEDASENNSAPTFNWVPAGTLAFDGPPAFDRVAFDAKTQQAFVLGRSTLTRSQWTEEGGFEMVETMNLPWDWTLLNRVPLGLLQGKLLIPLRGRELLVIDANTFDPIAELQMPTSSVPLSLSTDEASGLAVVTYANGTTWIFDSATNKFEQKFYVRNATGAIFNSDGNLVIGHELDYVTVVDPKSGNVVRQVRAETDLIRKAYDWAIEPLYSVFPKPNECYVLIEHLTGGDTMDRSGDEDPSGDAPLDVDAFMVQTDDPWQPIRTSAIFAVILMLFNSFYFWRQEF